MSYNNITTGGTVVKCRRFEGKVAVVAGATEGMGFAMAERLAIEGASVVICSRNEKNVKSALQTLRNRGHTVEGVACHIGKAEDRKLLFDTAVKVFGGVDILVSNAGVNPSPGIGEILQVPESAYDKIFDINVKAQWQLCQLAVPLMIKRGGGNILFIGSIGAYDPRKSIGLYCASKTALLGLTKALANEHAVNNIRVNCVVPGPIETKFANILLTKEEIFATMYPLLIKRLGQPDEIAAAVAFLVSDDASYITGESLTVGGGFNSHL